MLSAAAWLVRSSRSRAASGMARMAAVARFTRRRKATSPQSAPARRRPRRAASRIIASEASSEERVLFQEVLEPEHPAHRPFGRSALGDGGVVGPAVVAGVDVERDLAERIHDRGPPPGPRLPEARPPVL